jgi:hypothetical protein
VGGTQDVEAAVIGAIQHGTLAAWASRAVRQPEHAELATRALRAVTTIGADGTAAVGELAARLDEVAVAHRFSGEPAEQADRPAPQLQRIAFDVWVEPLDVDRALLVTGALGYRPWYDLNGPAWPAYRRFYPALPLVAETEAGHPIVVHLRWRDEPEPGPIGRRLRPAPEELGARRLPGWAWPAHAAGHVAGQVAGRARRRVGHAAAPADLGPFLPTPVGVIDVLLDLAEVGPDDTLVDLGCGDGRVLVRAAVSRGCRAIGVDHDAGLVRRAREAAAAVGVGDRVQVELGDVAGFDPAGATVAVLFLAAEALPATVAALRGRLGVGGRIVAHEQAPLPLSADRSVPVLTRAGITVAHRWDC